MANTFSLTTHGLPNPEQMSTGKDVESDEWRALTGTINHVHANLWAQPVWSQGWPSNQHQRGGGAKQNTSHPLAIPILSAGHTTVTCEVYATIGATGGGTIYVTSANTGNMATIVVNSTGYHSATLGGIGTTAVYDRLTVSIAAATGTITVNELFVGFDALTSPLTSNVIGETSGGAFYPHGEAIVGTEFPVPSALGYQVIDNLRELNTRNRSITAWAGLITTDLTPSTSKRDASPYMQRTVNGHFITSHRGAQAQGVNYSLRAYVQPHSTSATYIRVSNGKWSPDGQRIRGSRVESITVAAGAAATWVSATFPLVDSLFGEQPIYSVPGVDYTTTWLGISIIPWANSAPPTATPDGTNARIMSISMWGR